MAGKYIKVTEREFNLIRHAVYSSESQAGAMDDEPADEAYKAYEAVQKAEKRNGLKPLNFT